MKQKNLAWLPLQTNYIVQVKLEHYQIRGIADDWFKSMFSDKRQYQLMDSVITMLCLNIEFPKALAELILFLICRVGK